MFRHLRVDVLVQPGDGVVVDVLYPYPEDFFNPIRWAKGGIYPLMPYSNRIANATVQVNGKAHALRPHPDAVPHTLHGNAHAQPWQTGAVEPSRVTLTLDSIAGAAWPWRYAPSMAFTLTPSQLSVDLELRNTDLRPMPAGMGLHPYFMHDPAALLGYGATTLWPANPEFLPSAPRPLRADECHMPPRVLPDGTMTDYLGGWDGTAVLDLPQGARLGISADPVFGHLVVHRPTTPIYLCVEPVSHVADGFNLAARGASNTGARMLAPGEHMRGEIRFALLDSTIRRSW